MSNQYYNHKLSKAILDASWGEFSRQLEYKLRWQGKRLVKIDTFFPSSKTKKQNVFQKIVAFVEKFKGVGGQVA